MFYLIQANELANSWSRLVAQKNQWDTISKEAEQYLEATQEAILFAISEQTLPIRNSAGAKLPASALGGELDTFISLQDFCNWGSEYGAKLGTPECEFELAYNLGIHLLSDESIESSMVLKDSHPNLPTVVKQPLRIRQILAPGNEKTRGFVLLAKEEPWKFFSKDLDSAVLEYTPSILIYPKISGADLTSTLTPETQPQRKKPSGIFTTSMARLLCSGTSRINEDYLKRKLGRGDLPKWLKEARLRNGTRGKLERVWDPVVLSIALINNREFTRAQANSMFNQSELTEWKEWWVESVHLLTDSLE